jgi:hypothetical protein
MFDDSPGKKRAFRLALGPRLVVNFCPVKARFLFLTFLALVLASCDLRRQPPTPIIPTPGPTAIPFSEQLALSQAQTIIDPATDIRPQADPEILALVEQVSTQNLMGYVYGLQSYGTRNTFSVTDEEDFGIGAARRWLFDEFVRVGNGRLRVEFQDYSFNFLGLSTTQRNIIATLPGDDPNAGAIVMMANYDTRTGDWIDGESLSPGADDNGSGVAAMLEVARLMSSRNWNQTVIFAAFTAEEQGTYGSRHFVQQAFLAGIDIDAAINNDMIGGRNGIPQTVRIYSEGPTTSVSRHLARYIDYLGGIYLPIFPIWMMDGLDREGRWGDQREFVNAGYASVRIIESQEDEDIQNSVRDVWNRIDYQYLKQVTSLNLIALSSAAAGPPRPDVPVVIADDGGSVRVGWTPHERAAAYVVSIRPFDIEGDRFGPFRFVGADNAGDVLLTGYNPAQPYAVSIAGVDEQGRLGLFSSPEVVIYER